MPRKLNEFQLSIQKMGSPLYTKVATKELIAAAKLELGIRSKSGTAKQNQDIYELIKSQHRAAQHIDLTAAPVTPPRADDDDTEEFVIGGDGELETAAPSLLDGTVKPFLMGLSINSGWNDIGTIGSMHLQKSAAHLLAFAWCVGLVYEKCESVSGGTNFAGQVKELWGHDRTTAGQYLQLYHRSSRLQEFLQVLPHSLSALLELSRLEDDVFTELAESNTITPTMTAREAKELRLGAPEDTEPTLAELQVKRERMAKGLARLDAQIAEME